MEKSDSIVNDTSVSNSASAAASNSTVISESTSMEVAISESQSAYDNTSQTHQYGDLTSNVASALSTYDSALSVLGSTSEAGAANLDAVRKSVAESIIVYNIANHNRHDNIFEPLKVILRAKYSLHLHISSASLTS